MNKKIIERIWEDLNHLSVDSVDIELLLLVADARRYVYELMVINNRKESKDD